MKEKMVDTTGIEPVTFPMSRGRATAAPRVLIADKAGFFSIKSRNGASL